MVESPKKKPAFKAEAGLDAKTGQHSLFLIYGNDDYLVTEEARRIIATLLPKEALEFGLEIVDGLASNQTEATAIFGRLFESLQSQSFFAAEKVVWWRNTNLFGTNQTAATDAVSDYLSSLNDFIKDGLPQGISLVITSTEPDGRRGIIKTITKAGKVIAFDPGRKEGNQVQALIFARETAAKFGKKLDEEAGFLLVEMSGGDSRTIRSELEKLAAYTGTEDTIREKEVHEIGSWRPGCVVWDLPDAVGERNFGKALNVLNDLLFAGGEPVALLFAIIHRMRLLLLLSVLVEKKLLRAGGDSSSFKFQMERLPSWVTESLSQDKKFNPLAAHPYALYKAAPGVSRYTRVELQEAMRTLLECNERMFSSGSNPGSLLEEALFKICMKA